MKTTKTTLLAIATIALSIGIAACGSSKKASATIASSVSTPASTTTATPAKPAFSVAKSADGIYPPENEELTAIQLQHKDVTLEKLQEGYKIYTEGACVNCHKPESIYRYEENQWKWIIEDMAQRARISDPEKDAVYKYVLAIKANQK